MLLRAVGHFQRGLTPPPPTTTTHARSITFLAVVCVLCGCAWACSRIPVFAYSRVHVCVCVCALCLRFAGALSFDSTATSAAIEKCLLSSVTVTAT